MQLYKHLFFDLDHTLWDFSTNEKITLNELFVKYNLTEYFNSFEDFYSQYAPINKLLWGKYRKGEIKKKEVATGRFHQTFFKAGLNNEALSEQFAKEFVLENSNKTAVIPDAFELLDYLIPKYSLYIITNGFIETQYKKLEISGLKPYFKKVFISEEISAPKPKRAFFEHAIKSTNAKKKESLVIGDSLETDIAGAKNFGIDHIYFNPQATPHNEVVFMEIRSLMELMDCL